VREPLLGKTPSLWSYLVILVVTLVGWVATFKMFRAIARESRSGSDHGYES
jgi:hypothetical protein